MKPDTLYDIAKLKASGLMKQKEPDLFSVRVKVVGGHVEAEQLAALARIAQSCGLGCVHLTTRQGLEIPNVHFRDIEKLRAGLAEVGMEFSTGGPRVRTITACQGRSCTHGLIDPQALARKIDGRVSGRSGLPHKFKIGIAGCPNACTKPRENDLGIMGVAGRIFHGDLCNRCGTCIPGCRAPGALEIVGDQLVCREEICVQCGDCVAACPFDAWELTGATYAVFVGGKMGKRPRLADRLPRDVVGEENLLHIVERTIEWYAENGERKERFGNTLDRVGIASLAGCLSSAL